MEKQHPFFCNSNQKHISHVYDYVASPFLLKARCFRAEGTTFGSFASKNVFSFMPDVGFQKLSNVFNVWPQSARLAARLSYCGNMCLSYVQNRTWHFLAEKSKAFPEKEAVCMATYIAPKPLFTIYSKVYLCTPVSL